MNRRRILIGASIAAVGALGVGAYVRSYWVYRGFPPPSRPKRVTIPGTNRTVDVRSGYVQAIDLSSAAVGRKHQPFYVFLPPGYFDDATRRYPVLYLMHGLRSDPRTFLNVGRGGVQQETLVAQGRMQPLILVAPSGAGAGLHSDTEWVNGIGRGSAWETFITRDLVHAVDARFRTIQSARGRGIGGLSEGGFAALNIAIHNPREFGFAESWSGYMKADATVTSVYDHDRARLDYNSPMIQIERHAAALRRAGIDFWFYIGRDDPDERQNIAFAAELAHQHLPHTFFLTSGAHNWALWRRYTPEALIAASKHLAHA